MLGSTKCKWVQLDNLFWHGGKGVLPRVIYNIKIFGISAFNKQLKNELGRWIRHTT